MGAYADTLEARYLPCLKGTDLYVPDSDADKCQLELCQTFDTPFTTGWYGSWKGTNRHHCRACGRVVCKGCLTSNFTGPAPDTVTKKNDNLKDYNIIMNDGKPHKSCKECRRKAHEIDQEVFEDTPWFDDDNYVLANVYKRVLWGRYVFLCMVKTKLQAVLRLRELRINAMEIKNLYAPVWYTQDVKTILKRIETVYGPIGHH